ncbi:MAG: hypothetical protein NT018_14070 [Armatimonadetes bacterium]|nr:hypothetical protein [Armatimonadota bacterium]
MNRKVSLMCMLVVIAGVFLVPGMATAHSYWGTVVDNAAIVIDTSLGNMTAREEVAAINQNWDHWNGLCSVTMPQVRMAGMSPVKNYSTADLGTVKVLTYRHIDPITGLPVTPHFAALTPVVSVRYEALLEPFTEVKEEVTEATIKEHLTLLGTSTDSVNDFALNFTLPTTGCFEPIIIATPLDAGGLEITGDYTTGTVSTVLVQAPRAFSFVVNPGFEDPVNGTPWYNQAAWGACTGATTTAEAHEGVQSWATTGAAIGAIDCVEQNVPIMSGGLTYAVSYWVKIPTASESNPAKVDIRAWFGTPANYYISGFYSAGGSAGITVATPDWVQITDGLGGFTPAAECTQVILRARITSLDPAMVAYVDYASVATGVYFISGTVDLSDAGDPTGTVVTLSNGASTIIADSSGAYSFPVGLGTYTVSASKTLYATTASDPVIVDTKDEIVPLITLPRVLTGTISGTITDESGPVEGIIVTASDFVNHSLVPIDSAPTGVDGVYTVEVALTAPGSQGYFLAIKNMPVGKTVITGPTYPIDPESGYPYGFSPPATDKDFVIGPDPDYDTDLVFSARSDEISGSSWPLAYSENAVTALTAIGTPSVENIGGVQWEQNLYADGDGYRYGVAYTAPIPCPTGASIVVVAKPLRNGIGTSWTSIVDCFYNNLVIGIRNNTGEVVVCRNNTWNSTGYFIEDGQKVILSLVVQADGTYIVYANGLAISTVTALSPYINITPGGAGHEKNINVGRNNPDGWTTFNGNIGDVFLYKVALDNAKREALEASLGTKFAINTTIYTIDASVSGVGGSMVPTGTLSVPAETNKVFTITPAVGYRIADVVVDSISVKGDLVAGAGFSTYTFLNLADDHIMVTTFEEIPPLLVSGKVTDGTAGILGAKVYFKLSPNASVSPNFETTTIDADGNYSQLLPPGDWYVCASADTYFTSADVTFSVVDIPVVLDDIVLVTNPNWDVLFIAENTGFGGGSWATTYPAGGSLTIIGTPTNETIGGVQWARNKADGDGFHFANIPEGTPLVMNGGTIVVVAKPILYTPGSNYQHLVSVLLNQFSIGIQRDTGQLRVWRGGIQYNGPIILNEQKVVFSLVVQPTGPFKVFANGVQIMDELSTSPFTNLYAPYWYGTDINVGKAWNGDGWSSYNGNIGDVYVYKKALDDTARAALEASLMAKFSASNTTWMINVSYGTGGTILPGPGDVVVADGANKTFTITPSVGFKILDVLVDGITNPGAIAAGSYTFTEVLANHTISATFEALPNQPVSGKVTDGAAGIMGATVYFKTSPNASVSPTFQTTTIDADGNYSYSLPFGNWYAAAGAVGYNTSADVTFSIVDVPVVLADIVLTVNPNYDLIFKAYSTDLVPADGLPTGNWSTAYPVGGLLTAMGTPTVQVINGTKWEKNLADGPGYRYGSAYTAPIPVNGVTGVVVIKMPAARTASNNWDSVIDVFYSRFILGVRNDTGLVNVRRNGGVNLAPAGTALIEGQKVVLSCVVQPTGQYRVYTNGTLIWDNTSLSTMTSLVPLVDGGFANTINVGRNGPDGWTTFNGNIGDVYLFNTAISDAKRTALEASLITKFAINTNIYTIAASAGVGGTISPTGTVNVPGETDKTFTITPGYGYKILDVLKDGISVGTPTSVTFVNVTENGHTIAASFEKLPGITGTVSDVNGPIDLALVSYSTNPDGSAPVYTTKTDATGTYWLYPPSGSTYYLLAKKSAHVTSAPLAVALGGVDVTGQNFVLAISDGLRVNIKASDLTVGAWGAQVLNNTGTLGGNFTPVGIAPVVATIVDSAGVSKKAITFAGGTGAVGAGTGLQSSVNTTADFTGNSDWSVSSWVYVPAIPASANRTYFSWASRGTNFSSAEMRYSNNYAIAHYSADNGFNLGVPAAGRWHNIIVSYDGTAERLYVDGVLDRTINSLALTLKANEKMFVGRATEAAGTSNYAWTGSVASIKVFDQVLSTEEIAMENGNIPIKGKVTLQDGITPVAGALVIGGLTSPLTDVNGNYMTTAKSGATVWISASKAGYLTVLPVDGTYEVLVGEVPITGIDFRMVHPTVTGIV